MSASPTQSLVIETRRGADALSLSLMLFMAVNSVAISLMPVVTNELQNRFAFTSSQIGLLTSTYMVAFALGALPMGLVAARLGGRTLVLGAVLLVAGGVLFALSASYPWFLVGRFLQGLGGATIIPVCNPLMAHAISKRYHDRALGIFGAGHGLGVVAALLILPSIQQAGGYRAAFLASAGLGAAIALIALIQRPVRARPSHPEEAVTFVGLMRGVGAVAANRRLLLLILVNIGVMAIVVGLLAWTPLFLHDQRGTSLSVAAYLTAGVGVAQIIGNLAGAAAMSRWGKPFVLVVGMAVMFLATALVPFVPGFVLVFACVTVAGFLTMAVFPAIIGSVAEVVDRPEQVGPATGFLNLTNIVGTWFAPWLFGVLLDSYGTGPGRSGYLLGYMLLALFPFLGTLAAVVYMGRRAPA
jgi:predicted MFS family arabinose efflux permease